jgi:hypothetical protein
MYACPSAFPETDIFGTLAIDVYQRTIQHNANLRTVDTIVYVISYITSNCQFSNAFIIAPAKFKQFCRLNYSNC